MTLTDIRKTLEKIRYKIFSLEKIYILSRPLPFEPDERLSKIIKKIPTSCVIKRLTLSSNDLFRQYIEFKDEVKKENVKEWLKDEHICLLALINNKIIGSMWIATRYMPFSNAKIIPIFKEAAYVFKLFVSPDFRCRGIGAFLLFDILRICYELGFKKIIALAYTWNRPSLSLLEKLRFRITNKLFLLKAGPFKQYFLRTYSH